MNRIRQMAVAGRFYPAGSVRTRAYIEAQLNALPSCGQVERGATRALIVPHAGFQFSGGCAAKGFSSLVSAKGRVKRVVILAPSHHLHFNGVSVGNYSGYDTPFGTMPVDVAACGEILSRCEAASFIEEAHVNEHAIEVQLPFLYQLLGPVPIVPMLCGTMTAELLAQLAAFMTTFWEEDTLWVISSDFTHYGAPFNYLPFTGCIQDNLRTLDGGAIAEILVNNVDGFRRYMEETGATVCGRTPIELLLTVVADEVLDISLGDYMTSASITGEVDYSVSYASMIFAESGVEEGDQKNVVLNGDEKRLLHQLVKEAIEAHFESQELTIRKALLPEVLHQKAGCFVTLYLHGKLRGCVGYLEATEPLYLHIVHTAKGAAFEDCRFMPLTRDELQEIEVEISVLTPSVKVENYRDIVIGRDGIIFEKGNHHAVFLPKVALEQGWDLETTLGHLSEKAGLGSNAWRSHSKFRIFGAYTF